MQTTRLYRWMKQLGFGDYESFFQASIDDINWFWGEAEKALGIAWFAPYTRVLDLSRGIEWPEWYVGGKLNVTYNAVDKWLVDPQISTRPAVVWEGEDGTVVTYTYEQLSAAIDRFARGLRREGIAKGDRVAIYMPLLPETIVAILAIIKIGAIFIPCFSGYKADAVAKRLTGAQVKMLISADGYLRRGKAVAMKEEADKACALAPSVQKLVVVRRLGRDVAWQSGRDLDWRDLAKSETESTAHFERADRAHKAYRVDPAHKEPTAAAYRPLAAEQTNGNDPFMIIYTSGTTGRPKGAVHTHNGFALKSAFDAAFSMDLKPGDILCWLTDMGWMMGPFLMFASLFNAATMVLYEGTPTYPEADRVWQLVEDHRMTHLGLSPTLIRSLMPHGEQLVKRHDLSSLQGIASTGEPWNPEPWHWLFETVGQKRVPIYNYSGGTEISGGILGNVPLKPIAPISFNSPLPGMDVDVYDAEGRPVRSEVGELVIKQPWVGMTNGFWEEPERYKKTYWSRWPNTWVHGDWVILDDDSGQWVITGRSDDTLNVAGKRLGPAEVESVLVAHPAVLEAGTIGIPDEVKGEVPVCFVVLKSVTSAARSPDGKLKPNEGSRYSTSRATGDVTEQGRQAPSASQVAQLHDELMVLVAERLGKSLCPKAIHFVPDLPKTRNAKIMRRAIRAAYLGHDPGDLSALDNPEAVTAIAHLSRVKNS
ncbi:AMP-binding protein [Numidum massiliense]|uniref:AMP-binding protein n=1 Tax=Numidum massiliense TaxID=1522315 RepID=UPI0006D5B11E